MGIYCNKPNLITDYDSYLIISCKTGLFLIKKNVLFFARTKHTSIAHVFSIRMAELKCICIYALVVTKYSLWLVNTSTCTTCNYTAYV